MKEFRRAGTEYAAALNHVENDLLHWALEQVLELLHITDAGEGGQPAEDSPNDDGALPLMTWSQGPLEPPTDSALARLFPTASREDAQLSAEFRRLTEPELRREKTTRLQELLESLPAVHGIRGRPWTIAAERGPAFAAALTDVRLVVADRLGFRTDAEADQVYRWARSDSGPRGFLASVYVVTSYVQDSLVECMLTDAGQPGD